MILLANAGTPLLWASFFTLLVGNLLLGNIEAWLLSKFLKRPIKPGLLIFANYFSMALGYGLLTLANPLLEPVQRDPIRLGLSAFLGLMATAWVLTVLLEWPFVARATEQKLNRSSLLLSLKVQSLTYVGMNLVALVLGSVSAITHLHTDPNLATVPGWVYTVGHDSTTVYRTRLDGSKTERIVQINDKELTSSDRVFLRHSPDKNAARLVLTKSDGKETILQDRVGTSQQIAPNWNGHVPSGTMWGSTRSFIKGQRVSSGAWAYDGLFVNGDRYALETPFLSVLARSPIVLPDGKVVFQFGKAVLLLDPVTRATRKITEGLCGDVLTDSAVAPDPFANLQGFYRLKSGMGFDPDADTPPGQILHLGITKDKWLFRDMMVGFGGVWKVKKDEKGSAELSFELTDGPSGKTKRERVKVEVAIDEVKLFLAPKGQPLVFEPIADEIPEGFGIDGFVTSN